MLIYWILLFTISSIGMIQLISSDKSTNFNKVQSNIFLLLSGLLLWIVSGFRGPYVGTDTLSYLSIYDFSVSLPVQRLIKDTFGIEKGYILLNKLLSVVFDNRYSIILFTSLLIIFGVLYFIKNNSSNLFMSVYLFITLYYFSVSMNIIRQFMVIAIFFIAYEKLKKSKIISFVLLILLASTIHSTALIYLGVLLISKIKPSVKNMRVIGLTAATLTAIFYVSPSIITSISGRYSQYAGTKFFEGNSVGGTTIIWVAQIILYFCSMYILKNNLELTESHKKSLFMFSVMILISVCIGIISTRIYIITRLIYYFDIFMIVLIPEIVNQLIREKLFAKYLIYLVLALYFLYNLRQGGSGVVPYEFVWQTF